MDKFNYKLMLTMMKFITNVQQFGLLPDINSHCQLRREGKGGNNRQNGIAFV
jgi:hypothetical protein